MADRSITIRLGANVTGLVSGFKTAQQSVKDFGSQTQSFVQNNRQSLEQVGQAGMVAGGVLAAGFGMAVTKFAAFDKAMSSVQAATHETEGNMESLRQAAIDAGADTAFSAEEAARGIEEMAKAGVSTADILDGGLNGALSLAAAGALDVGEAAELAATAMTQFGLSGEDIPHIADLLAAGAGKAQGSVQDMGAALKQVGLVADQTGLTIEETTGGLAAFASAGLVGSDAGTSFKSMLQRLNPQSEEAATLMSDLGLSAYDSQGNFIGLSEYAGELQQALGGMSTEQRNAAMSTLFGSDAVRAASVLYEQGAAGVQKWEDAVNDAGFAAETAAIMQDNLAGDLEKLGGAFDTVFLQAGSGANDALRGLVQTLEEFVDWVGEIPGPVLSTVGVLAGLTGGAALLGGAFITAVPKINDTVTAINDLRTKAPGAATAIGRVTKAAGLAAAAFTAWEIAKSIHNNMEPATQDIEVFAKAIEGLKSNADTLDATFANIDAGAGGAFLDNIDTVGQALDELINQDFSGAFGSFGATALGINNDFAKMADAISKTDQSIAELANSGNLDAAARGFQAVTDSAAAQGIEIEDVAARFPAYRDALDAAAKAQGLVLTDGQLMNYMLGEVPAGMEAAAVSAEETAAALEAEAAEAEAAAQATAAMNEALAEIGLTAEGTIADLALFSEALLNTGLVQLSANDAARGFEAAIDDVGTKIEGIIGTYGSLNGILTENADGFNRDTAAGREAEAAFDAVASSGSALTQALAENGGTQKELQGSLRGTYDSLIVAAGQFGITGEQADTLARKTMGIPDEANIDTWMSDAARQKADETIGRVEALDGKTANVYINTHDTTYKTTIHSSKQEAISKQGTTRGPDAFATGGYTGAGGRFEPAGIVHRGEYVLDQDDVRALGGPGRLDRWRSQLKAGGAGYSMSGQVQGRQVPAMAVSGMSAGGDRHIHIDAAPGVAYQYAKEVAVHAEQRERNAQAAYGI